MTILPFLFFNKINVNRFVKSVNSSSRKARSGVSPVIATTIILAITITLGLSLWSFANSGIGAAATSYTNIVTDFGKFASDNFVIANIAFGYPSANQATVWVYNSGQRATDITNVILSCKDCTSFTPVSVDLSQSIPAKSLQTISFTSGALADGKTYEVRVISSTGAYEVHYQEK